LEFAEEILKTAGCYEKSPVHRRAPAVTLQKHFQQFQTGQLTFYIAQRQSPELDSVQGRKELS